jgi:hypothetical protein
LLPGDKFSDFDRKNCLSESLSKPNVLLIGDSHAAHLWFGLQAVFNRTNIMQATSTGCGPFVIRQQNAAGQHEECEQLMSFIYNDYLPHHHPDLIIVADRWGDFDCEAGLAGLETTLDWLRQRQFAVLLAGPDHNWDVALPILVALALQRADPGLVERHQLTGVEALDLRLAALAAAHDTKYVSIYRALCKPSCQIFGDSGRPLMWDHDHLTTEGSELVAKQFNNPSLLR